MGSIRMRANLSAALLCAAVLSCGSVLAQDPSPAPPSLSQGRGFDEQGGAALYANVCAACHQADAKGAVGAAAYPALAENGNLASPDYVMSAIFQGIGAMPPVGRMMSDAQAADVINYVRTHFGNRYDDAVSAADVTAARAQFGSGR
jgi:mono/diheme cytochrome c family protein